MPHSKEISVPLIKELEVKKSIGEMLFEGLNVNADQVAQIDPLTGQSETYKSIKSRSVAVAQNLRLRGISPGDIISLCTDNNLDYTPVVIASFFIGSYTAPLDPKLPLSDIVHNLKLTEPKVIFCDSDSESLVEQALKQAGLNTDIVVFGGSDRNIHFDDFLIEQEPEDSFTIHPIDNLYDTCCIHFSSGTTGLPKGVCVTHYGLASVCLNIASQNSSSKQIMIYTSPNWISNMNNLIVSVLVGNTRVLPKQFDEKTCLKYVQDYKVEILFFTPANGSRLIKNPDNDKYDVSSLIVVASGGSPTSTKQFLEYFKIFPNVILCEGYGMTETGGLNVGYIPKSIEDLKVNKKSPIGTPIPGYIYKVVNPDTEETCGLNEPGELRIKYPGLFKTYYKNPVAYKDAFDNEGFFKTGDVVFYDENLAFTYVTRIKDIFKYHGYHISPVTIEEQLLKHPYIKQAVVVGLPGTDEGDFAAAAVVVDDQRHFNANEFIHFVNDNLPDQYHIRAGVYLFDSFPVTSSGKIQRKKIMEIILQQLNNNNNNN